jgi:hypothetical protein
MTTLAQFLESPSEWAALDADVRQGIKDEAMQAALRALDAAGRKMARANEAAACPVAERIAAANALPAPRCVEDALFRPYWSPEVHKRDAAVTILRIRGNRAALGHAAPGMTAGLLERAARSRARAAFLLKDRRIR